MTYRYSPDTLISHLTPKIPKPTKKRKTHHQTCSIFHLLSIYILVISYLIYNSTTPTHLLITTSYFVFFSGVKSGLANYKIQGNTCMKHTCLKSNTDQHFTVHYFLCLRVKPEEVHHATSKFKTIVPKLRTIWPNRKAKEPIFERMYYSAAGVRRQPR